MGFHTMKVKVSAPDVLIITRRPEYAEWYKASTAVERRAYLTWAPVEEWRKFLRGKSLSRVIIDPEVHEEVKALGKDFMRALNFDLRAWAFASHLPQDKLIVVKDMPAHTQTTESTT